MGMCGCEKTQPWPHTAVMYHEWNMRYWGITEKCRGKKKNQSLQKRGFWNHDFPLASLFESPRTQLFGVTG